jgi:RimJ/RimL family protein N-acetyltransferase
MMIEGRPRLPVADRFTLRDRAMTLRAATATDDAFLQLLNRQERCAVYSCLGLPDPLLEKMLATHLRAQTEGFVEQYRGAERVLVCRQGEPIGRVWLALEGSGAARSLRLIDIALRTDVQGMGIGGDLLCSFVDSARAMRLERVIVSVFAGNDRGMKLCRRIGFGQQGVTDDAGNVTMVYPLG